MRFELKVAVGLLVVAAEFCAGSATTAYAATAPRSAGASSGVVYVASADNGPVAAYGAAASGAVDPVRTLDNPNLGDTVWDPWTVAVDSTAHVYVQSFVSDATTFVFGPKRSGPPTRVFRVAGPDSGSIAVDGNGYEYVMGGQGVAQVFVAAPKADGTPSDEYGVSPVRQFSTAQDGFAPWASTLSVDKGGEIVAAVTRTSRNEIEVFQGGATGSSRPERVIAGPTTGLGACASFQTCEHVSVASSPSTDRIYVAVSAASTTHVSVFAPGANGDAKPLRTIEGSATGLAGNVVTGVAVSQSSGDIFAMVKAAQFGGPAAVEVFGRQANGNEAPLRTFTDRSTGFKEAEGIAAEG
jgi:hypothetical protein